jgi:pimeloyl-ACP methyl ester carboxylesterase
MPLLQLKDTEIYYEVHGRGQPMVFLSETACDGEVWKIHQLEEFSRDHEVILHDYRGTGRSGKPSIEYSTKMFCDDAAALMDHLGAQKAIVIGHSMGRIAQRWRWNIRTRAIDSRVHRVPLSRPPKASLKICQEMIEWGYEKYARITPFLLALPMSSQKSTRSVWRSTPCGWRIFVR